MTYRQLILLGGAAVVLAACADVTAPGTGMRRAGVESAAKAKPSNQSTTSPTSTAPTASDAGMTTSCERGGYTVGVRSGDSSCTMPDGE